VETFDAK
jgi:regulatory LuxR family protein